MNTDERMQYELDKQLNDLTESSQMQKENEDAWRRARDDHQQAVKRQQQEPARPVVTISDVLSGLTGDVTFKTNSGNGGAVAEVVTRMCNTIGKNYSVQHGINQGEKNITIKVE